MEKIRATVGILTFNSEKNLARALASVQDFGEIILADGGSTDQTLEIGKRYGAKIISQSHPGKPITDFALERNRLLQAATEPWFIHLDSDEIMTPELVTFVRGVASDAGHTNKAYKIRYLKTNEDGTRPYRTLKEYYQIRMVRMDIGAHYIRPVHEKMELPPHTPTGQTEAPWYVPLDADDLKVRAFASKAWKRTRMTARSWTPRGLLDVLRMVVVEPLVLIGKSLVKMVLVRIKWGGKSIPLQYEFNRILYSLMLSVRSLERALGILPGLPPAGMTTVAYVFHGRLPDPRAAALFAVEEARSLRDAGVEVTLMVPSRDTTDLALARKVHAIPETVGLKTLPVLDTFRNAALKSLSFEISMLTFAFALYKELKAHPVSVVVTTDHLLALVAGWAGIPALLEVHDFPSRANVVWRAVLARAPLILATNEWKLKALQERYHIAPERLLMERNGIDLETFSGVETIEEARKMLELPHDIQIALYTGNLYGWKGVDTLVAAAKRIPSVAVYIVGGTKDAQDMLRGSASSNVHFVARVPHALVAHYQAAADVLVLPNTAREEISSHYTSPLKLFEYMASARPIVASDLPSIREVLPQDVGYYVHPDDPASLAEGITEALATGKSEKRGERARDIALGHSWSARAERIVARLKTL